MGRPEEEKKLKENGLANRAPRPAPVRRAPARPVRRAPVPQAPEENVAGYHAFIAGFDSDSDSDSEEDIDNDAIHHVEFEFMRGFANSESETEEESSDMSDEEVEYAERHFMAGWGTDSEWESTESDAGEVMSDEEDDVNYQRFNAGFVGDIYVNFIEGFESEIDGETDSDESDCDSESEPLWTTEEEDNDEVEQPSSLPAFVPREEPSNPFVQALPIFKSCSSELDEEPFFEIPALKMAESF